MNESFARLSKMTEKQKSKYMDYYNNVLLTGVGGVKFEKPFDKPIDNLYFDIEYLNNVGIAIVMLPIELMAEYRDIVTEERIDHWNKFGKKIKVEDLEQFDIKKDFDGLNATSLGNIAYTILNSDNKEIVDYSINILNQIFVKYKGMLLQQLNDTI